MNARRQVTLWVVLLAAASLISLAVWLAGSKCRAHGDLRTRERILRQNLDTLRKTIDAYTYDKRKAPQSLHDLVSAWYLRKIPPDPTTGHADWQMSDDDVRSASPLQSCEGTPYNTW